MLNRNAMTRRAFVGAAAVASTLAVIPAAHAGTVAAANDDGAPAAPRTIPALREWTSTAGSFRLGLGSRILVHPDQGGRLLRTARTFAADLKAIGYPVDVETNARSARTGDIVLRLGATDSALGEEGYQLLVGDSVTITANATAGVFYGSRTILQLVRQSATIPAGLARDWPRFAERGLMVDNARMHFSPDWLADRVRDMAYLKLNLLHLHFTDDEGWRIESDLGVQSSPCLSKQQVRELVALAAEYHVTVVPEIDMPSHMTALLAHYPEFQLKDANGTAVAGKLDYTIPAARQLLRDLISEYLPLFPGPYWHMGTDEFLSDAEYAKYSQLAAYAQANHGPDALGRDGLIGLINETNTFVRRRGKTLRIWNDLLAPGATVQVDKDVVVEWWTDLWTPYPQTTNPDAPQLLLDSGYTVLNSSFFPTYDYPAGPPVQPSVQWMYENWQVSAFHGFAYFNDQGSGFPFHDVDATAPGLAGSVVNLWNSGGSWTQQQAAESIHPRLRVMAQKTWESAPIAATYAEFDNLASAVGSAPGVN